AKSKTVFFRHNNSRDLERKLAKERGKKLVVVEGVYSMDGHRAGGDRRSDRPKRRTVALRASVSSDRSRIMFPDHFTHDEHGVMGCNTASVGPAGVGPGSQGGFRVKEALGPV